MDDPDEGDSMLPSDQNDTPLSDLIDLEWKDYLQTIIEWDGWDRPVEVETTSTETLLHGPLEMSTEPSEPTVVTDCQESTIQQSASQGKTVGPSSAEGGTTDSEDSINHSEYASFKPIAHQSRNEVAEKSPCSSSHANDVALQTEMTAGPETTLSDALVDDGPCEVGIEADTAASTKEIEPETGAEISKSSTKAEIGMPMDTVDVKSQLPSTRTVEPSPVQPETASGQTLNRSDAFKNTDISTSNSQLDVAATSPCQPDSTISSRPSTTDLETKAASPALKDHEIHTMGTQEVHGNLRGDTDIVEGQVDPAVANVDVLADKSASSPSQLSPGPDVVSVYSAMANLRITPTPTPLSRRQTPELVSPQNSHPRDSEISQTANDTYQEAEHMTVEQPTSSTQVEVSILNRLSPDLAVHDDRVEIASTSDTDISPEENQAPDVEPNKSTVLAEEDTSITSMENVNHQAQIGGMIGGNDIETPGEQNVECIAKTVGTQPKKSGEGVLDTAADSDEDFLPVQFEESTGDKSPSNSTSDTVDSSNRVQVELARNSNSIGQSTETDANGDDLPPSSAQDVQRLGQDGEEIIVSQLSQDGDITPPPTPGPEEFELTPLDPAKRSLTEPVDDIPDIYSKPLPFMTPAKGSLDNESIDIGSTADTDDPTRPPLEGLEESDACMSKEMKDEEEVLSDGDLVSTSVHMPEALEQHKSGISTSHDEQYVALHHVPDMLDNPPSPMDEVGLQDDIAQKEHAVAPSEIPDGKMEDSLDMKGVDPQSAVVLENAETSSILKDGSLAGTTATPRKPSLDTILKSAAKLKRQRSVRPSNPSSTKKKDKDFKFHSDGSDSDDYPAKKRRKSAPTPKKTSPKVIVPDKAETPPAEKLKVKKSTKSALSKELSALLGDEKKHLTGEEIDLTGTKRAAAMKGRNYAPQQQQQYVLMAPENAKANKEVRNRKPTPLAPSTEFEVAVSPSTKKEEPLRRHHNTRNSSLASFDEVALNAIVFKDPFADALVNKEVEGFSHDATETGTRRRSLRSQKASTPATLERNPLPDEIVDADPLADAIVDREVEQPTQDISENLAPTRTRRSQRTPTPAVAGNNAVSDGLKSQPKGTASQKAAAATTNVATAIIVPAQPKERKPSYEFHYGKRFTRGDKKIEEQRSAEKEKSMPTTATPVPKKPVKKATTIATPTTAPQTRARTRTETPVAEPTLAVPKTRGQKAATATATAMPAPEVQTKAAKRKTAPSSDGAGSPKVSPPSKRTRAGQAKKQEQKAKEMEDARPNTRAKAGRKSV